MTKKITYRILQLESLGKKHNQFIVSRNEVFSKSLDITSCVYGPTTKNNCKKFINKIIDQLQGEVMK